MRARTKSTWVVVAAMALGVAAGARWLTSGEVAEAHRAPVVASAEGEPIAAPVAVTVTPEVVAAPVESGAKARSERDGAALDALLARDPAAALAAAREDDQAFPSSPRRAERKWVEIQALVHLEQIGAARSEAYDFYAAYPDDARANAIEAMTGMHRGRVAANAGDTRAPVSP